MSSARGPTGMDAYYAILGARGGFEYKYIRWPTPQKGGANILILPDFMDLILQKFNPFNTAFLTTKEKNPLYRIATPSAKAFSTKAAVTTIQKVTGSTDTQMATIELHAVRRDVVIVLGRDVTPTKPLKVFSECVYKN